MAEIESTISAFPSRSETEQIKLASVLNMRQCITHGTKFELYFSYMAENGGAFSMCGRFTLRTPAKRLAEEFGVEGFPSIEARYNIAPTQTIFGVSQVEGARHVKQLRWGLVPSWAKDTSMSGRLINARSETVHEKPAFREAFKRRRSLIPADGFYEWQRRDGHSQPYYFMMNNERPFALAGLWDRWSGPDGEVLESCAILTTEANEVLRPVHDRMPVILSIDDYDLWLDADPRKLDSAKELLRPYPAAEMAAYPVSRSVNSPHRQGAELLNRITSQHQIYE